MVQRGLRLGHGFVGTGGVQTGPRRCPTVKQRQNLCVSVEPIRNPKECDGAVMTTMQASQPDDVFIEITHGCHVGAAYCNFAQGAGAKTSFL